MDPIPTLKLEPNYEGILNAKIFEELFGVLDQLGSVQGSKKAGNKIYSAESLKNEINKARGLVRTGVGINEKPLRDILETITRTGRLRAKVIELLEKEIREAGGADPIIQE